MRIKHFASFVIFLLALKGGAEKEIVLTKEHLENATLENFVVSEESPNQVQYVFEYSIFDISNFVRQGVNSRGVVFFFLETDTEKEQLLVILNGLKNKLQWAEYYTEHCYFDPEELLAFVVEPLPDRYKIVNFKIYDFRIDYFVEDELELKPLANEGDKQAYYQIPVYAEQNEWGTYNINWEQAHFSFKQYRYNSADKRFSYNYRYTPTLVELEPLLSTVTEWTIPTGYNAVAGNTNENFDVVFIAPEGKVENWENCEILYYNKETEETMQVVFASIFRYQDELLGITPAQNRDERVAFIVETKEFNYDFYFDPAGLTTDAFLRPSSYVEIFLP